MMGGKIGALVVMTLLWWALGPGSSTVAEQEDAVRQTAAIAETKP